MVQYIKHRAYPNGTDRYDVVLSKEVIGLGWPEIGSQVGKSKHEIMEELNSYPKYSFKTEHSLSVTAGYFIRLMGLEKGDRILIPYLNEFVTIASVESGYRFDANLANKYGMGHVVDVKILKTISVYDLSSQLKKSMDAMITISDLSRYAFEIENLITADVDTKNVSQQFESTTFTKSQGNTQLVLTITNNNLSDEDLRIFIEEVINKR